MDARGQLSEFLADIDAGKDDGTTVGETQTVTAGEKTEAQVEVTDAEDDKPTPDTDKDKTTTAEATVEKPETADAKPPTEEKPKDEPTKPDQTADLKKQLDTLDKRLRDTQAAFTRSQQELAELKKRPTETQADDPERKWLGGDEEVKQRLETLEKQVADARKAEAAARWEAAEATEKTKHDDWDKVVYEVFEPAVAADDKLRQEFVAAGGTPEAAYRLGRKLALRREIEADPEAYEAKLLERLKAKLVPTPETAGTKPGDAEPSTDPASRTLASVPDKTPKRKPQAAEDSADLLDEVVPRRGGARF